MDIHDLVDADSAKLVTGLAATPLALDELAERGVHLDADSPVVALGLVAIDDGIARVDERVRGFLRGDAAIDRRLRRIATVVREMPLAFDARGCAQIERALATTGPILVEGPARIGKTTAAVAAICGAGRAAIVADVDRLVTSEDPAGNLARLRREAVLADGVLVLRAREWSDTPLRDALVEAIEAGAVVTLHDASDLARGLAGARRIPIAMPTADAQRRIWRAALGDVDTAHVVARYPLPPGDIVLAAADVRARCELDGRSIGTDDLVAAARARVQHRLGDVAELVTTQLVWRDAILRDDIAARIRELIDAVRYRDRVLADWGFAAKLPYGRSVSALLSGPPGTGKTMVATLIGKELGLEVFRVDLSKVVSKYIGETEKQLGRVFDEARRCNAILLFDEADSLFAKRTAVKSSNDRFANLEVNFLLQRVEQHDGVVLLTTNAAPSIDKAFLRRLRFRIDFAEPDEDERARLWQSMIPAAAPLAPDVDYGALARRFRMSGGHIKNAIVRAALRAMGEGLRAIDQRTLAEAAVVEWTEMGHLTAPSEERTPGTQPRRFLRLA